MENAQDDSKKIKEETDEWKAKHKKLQENLELKEKEKEDVETKYNKTHLEYEKALHDISKSKKEISSLAETIERLTKENNALSRAAELLKTVTEKSKTMEYIKHFRKTQSFEDQAREFFEMCLALMQKNDNFKKTLAEVLMKVI